MPVLPLDTSTETAVGYELDTITLRDIASVRYVRHHEWLDHVLGSALPTSRILPPRIDPVGSLEAIGKRAEEARAAVQALSEEKERGEWQLNADADGAARVAEQITRLRNDFGQGTTEAATKEAEKVFGKTITEAPVLRPVPVTWNRAEAEIQAREAAEAAAEPLTAPTEPDTDMHVFDDMDIE